ncbi:MAG: chemotaxis protein CheX [Candidatus Aureabacteria bacterium]|nr:chemotaxis protein CheX [Candidatus Auribacterota bacterium]
MDAKFINPFISATLQVMETSAATKSERGSLFVKKGEGPLTDISGVIGVTGKFIGSINIGFPKDIAIKVVSNMLGGMKIDDIDDSVKDGIGEIANMVAGAAKVQLAEIGYTYKLSIPTVVVGRDHHLSFPPNVPCIVVPFTAIGLGDFYLEVALKMIIPIED